MKRLLIIFTLLGSIYTTNTFAQDKTPNVVSQSFKSSYDYAKDVNWSEVNGLYKAEFNLDEQRVFAFFNSDGKLVASARNLSTLELPVPLRVELKKNFKNYYVSDLFELNNDEGTTFYVTLEGSDSRLQLKSTSWDVWTSYKAGPQDFRVQQD